MRIDPETRVSRHVDYFGTEVLEFGIPTAHDHLTIDVRARVVTSEPPEPPGGPWEALQRARLRRGRRRVPAAAGRTRGSTARLDDLDGALRASTPLATLQLLCELVPDRFEYRRGVTYVGSTVADLLDGRRRRLPGLRPPLAAAAAPQGHRRALRLRLPVGGAAGRRLRLASRSTRTPGSRRCCRARDGRGEPVWVGADPTNRTLAGETPREDRSRPLLRRRPAGQGRLPRARATSDLEAGVTMTRLDPQTSARA